MILGINGFSSKSLFDYIDKNRRGYLTFYDFKEVIIKFGITTTDGYIKELLNMWCLNQTMSYEE